MLCAPVMRLLTHNMLVCPRTKTFPLELVISTCDDVDVDFSEAFVRRIIPRLDWNAFLNAAKQLPDKEVIALLPETAPQENGDLGDQVCRAIHRALLEWHVVEGELRADDGTRYLVRNGVPNLVITEVRQPASNSMEVDGADAAENKDHDDPNDEAVDDDN